MRSNNKSFPTYRSDWGPHAGWVLTDIWSGHINAPVIDGFEAVQSSAAAILASRPLLLRMVTPSKKEIVVAVQRDRRLLRRPVGADRDETVRDGTVGQGCNFIKSMGGGQRRLGVPAAIGGPINRMFSIRQAFIDIPKRYNRLNTNHKNRRNTILIECSTRYRPSTAYSILLKLYSTFSNIRTDHVIYRGT